MDASGNVYVGDTNNSVVRKVSSSGSITTYAGVAGGYYAGYGGDGGPATSAYLSNPHGLAVDPIGNLYIADTGNDAIREVTLDGIITTLTGNRYPGYSGDNGPAVDAQLSSPGAVAVDSNGNIYIADTGNYAIRKISTNGIITTVAGSGMWGYSGDNGPATSAQLASPSGVAVDAGGNIYIADSKFSSIRKVSVNGIITTIAGSGYGFFVDGGPAIATQLGGECYACDLSMH